MMDEPLWRDQKLRTLLLAVLMVVSVFAGAIAVAGVSAQ